jgi:hypothetical protein
MIFRHHSVIDQDDKFIKYNQLLCACQIINTKFIFYKELLLKLREVQEILDADIVVGKGKLDIEVSTAFGADLMSDVMAFAKAGSLLLTGLTNAQVIKTAATRNIAAIILDRGKEPSTEAIDMVKKL